MRFLCFIVFAWACAPLYGQESAWSVRNYSAIDGLPQSQVNMLLEDNNGYLWIGTHGGGLARFDGRSFKVYTTLDGMLSNIVTHLKLDARQICGLCIPAVSPGLMACDSQTSFNPGQPRTLIKCVAFLK